MKPTESLVKNEDLDSKLYYNLVEWGEPLVRRKILLLLHGSYRCNLKCIYCENQHLRSEYKGVTISEDMVREIVEKLGPALNEVTWHGGEPLLLPKSLLRALEEEKVKYGLDFTTTLQTNSVALDEETEEFLSRYGIKYGTSFDGLQNDISRGNLSTESILRGLSKPNSVGFISVTYKDTIDLLIDNYEYYKSLGIQDMQNCIVRENVIENTNPYLISNDIAIPKMLEYIDYWIHDIDHPLRDNYVIRWIRKLLGISHLCEDIYCLGGWLIIDPLGNIGFCGHSPVTEGIVNICDISDYNDIITHPNYLKSLYKQKKLVKSCEKCKWYHVCYGACMGLNYEYDSTYQTISPRNCEYTRRLLQGIYELIKDIDVSRRDIYNPLFLQILEEGNYYSLTEIKEIEKRYKIDG